ncbi:Fungal transcription factor [Fusarium oxysporum f. sp. vasinfectum]|nr:Fungal transcription factor [Fusarium oxysporum f. sp. vasinfectum]KAK2925210.1 Fungal transcription factor [Fusarium oxysporum f. sp. vasinfectum]
MVNYYRYEPSLPASIIFIVIFALSSTLHLFQIIKTRTWFFLPFLVGSIFETVGFIGRAIGAEQAPDYTFGPYVLQTLLLLLGPTCYAASIYMILGRYIRQLKGEQFSLIRPSWLTKIFLLGDVISIALQGIGGEKLVSADTPDDRTKGENIIIGGLIVQVLFFGLFIAVTGLFHFRFARQSTGQPFIWQRLLVIIYVASALILIRSLFRMIEYIEGHDGELQSKEVYVLVLDAVPMTIASVSLNIFHPSKYMKSARKSLNDSDSEVGLSDPQGHSLGTMILPVSYQSPVEVEPILPISPASSNLSSSDLFAGRTGSPAEQLLERQLLHHFVQMTQRATDIQATWSLWILEQATHSPCVLNGILGISAFHLRRFNEFDKALEVASHEYMACAIEGHRKDLRSGMSKRNSSSVAAVCALVSIHASVNGYYLAGENDERMPHGWFISFRRSMNLLHTASPFIENPTVSQEFKTIYPTIDKTTHPNPFSFLLYYNLTSTDINQEEVSICMPAVAYLSYIYAEMTTRKPLRFPAALSAKFIDLIKAKNPRALSINGYFFMVVKQGRQLWLIDGAPEREFDTIMRCLPMEWWSVMD